MKRFFLLVLSIFIFFFGFAQNSKSSFPLSNQAQVSILTASPGIYLFEAFGHTSLRINDPIRRVDWVYNFGTFDFEQENFYVNFVRGYMRYYLSVRDFNYVYETAFLRGVQLREQVINFTPEECQHIFDLLQENRKNENKYYYYDYFYDNCATRYRDMFQQVLGKKLAYGNPVPDSTFSIRQLMKKYLGPHQWGEFGIDLALATRIDRPAPFTDYMYLPDYFEMSMNKSTINRDTVLLPFVRSEHIVVEPPVRAIAEKASLGPISFFWILFAFVALWSFVDWRRKSRSVAIDFTFFFIVGLFGTCLLFLWLFTNHITAAQNYNLLWSCPLHGIAAFLLLRKNRPTYLRVYFLINAIVLSVFMLSWGFIPQDIHEALVPFVLLLLIRSLLIFSNRQQIQTQYRFMH